MVTIESIVELVAASGVVEDISKFDPVKTFKDNGIDSLDVFTIFLTVEEALAIKFTEDESNALKSASDIVEAINKR